MPTINDSLSLRDREANSRALAVLSHLKRIDIVALVVGSLPDGRFTLTSDVVIQVTSCPAKLKYRIESRVEDIMGDIAFDLVYRDGLPRHVQMKMDASSHVTSRQSGA